MSFEWNIIKSINDFKDNVHEDILSIYKLWFSLKENDYPAVDKICPITFFKFLPRLTVFNVENNNLRYKIVCEKEKQTLTINPTGMMIDNVYSSLKDTIILMLIKDIKLV